MTKSILSNQDLLTEIHPDWYFDIPEIKTLILGSFPPHSSKWSYPFYYPNKQNNFWKILAAIHKIELQYYSGQQAVAERQQLMIDLKVGVQNMGKTIIRKGLSSQDTDIEITEFQDILSIIHKHPELSKIIISGFSAKNSTYYAFIKYLQKHNVNYTEPKNISPNNTFEITVDNNVITCVIVNSTSTAARIKIENLVNQFIDAIY